MAQRCRCYDQALSRSCSQLLQTADEADPHHGSRTCPPSQQSDVLACHVLGRHWRRSVLNRCLLYVVDRAVVRPQCRQLCGSSANLFLIVLYEAVFVYRSRRIPTVSRVSVLGNSRKSVFVYRRHEHDKPLFASGKISACRAKSTFSQRKVRTSPSLQPVRVRSLMAPITAVASICSASIVRSTSPTRFSSASLRNRSRLFSGVAFQMPARV